MYLSIAYLVAFAIIVATMCILRILLLRKSSANRRSVRKVQRGFFGRATNKVSVSHPCLSACLRESERARARERVYY